MEEIELSIMARGYDPSGDLQPLLDQFGALNRCRVHLTVFPWEKAWAELVKVALYRTGADVSQIGANWVGNLVAMNALRPFPATELSALGGPAAFLTASWQSGSLADGRQQMWAVPWLADVRLIYYRRDWLTGAGVDERTAFQSPAQLEQTLQRLQDSGVTVPWVVPTQHAPNTLHNLASWVWAAGGDFISADGKRALLNRPEAHAGIRAYFGLHRFLAPAARHLDIHQSDNLFSQGEAAATISGPWLHLFYLRLAADSRILAHTGVTLPPGVPFVGGSSLVVWQHTRRERLAGELVRFLTSRPVQAVYARQAGLLPVRLDVLSEPPFADHPLYQVMAQGLKAGRSFPSFSLWGLVEDKLTAALARLWEDVLADPGLDLDAAIAERFDRLAQRLNWVLSQA